MSATKHYAPPTSLRLLQAQLAFAVYAAEDLKEQKHVLFYDLFAVPQLLVMNFHVAPAANKLAVFGGLLLFGPLFGPSGAVTAADRFLAEATVRAVVPSVLELELLDACVVPVSDRFVAHLHEMSAPDSTPTWSAKIDAFARTL